MKRMTEKINNPIFWISTAIFLCAPSPVALADLLPPGHKAVDHHLIFNSSVALQNHRLVAAPIRGFHGFAEICQGQPVPFSTKYGTKIFAVPTDYQFPEKYRLEDLEDFPSTAPPVHAITSLSVLRSTAQIKTFCEVISVTKSAVVVRVIGEKEYDELGNPSKGGWSATGKIILSVIGLLGCLVLRIGLSRHKRIQLEEDKKAKNSDSKTDHKLNPMGPE